MYDLMKDLSDPTYLNGFFNFVTQPFDLAIYITSILGVIYLSGVFITALITKLVAWILKVNIRDDEFYTYWSWLGLCYFLFKALSHWKHKSS
jgi:hypothetical protein